MRLNIKEKALSFRALSKKIRNYPRIKISELYSYIRSKLRLVKYIIADTPSFCKDLFNLKCNQFTMRDCALKNFAIQYIDINSRNAFQIYKEAQAEGDEETMHEYWYIHKIMQMYAAELENQKQFLVMKKNMSDKEISEAAKRHPSLFKRSEKVDTDDNN